MRFCKPVTFDHKCNPRPHTHATPHLSMTTGAAACPRSATGGCITAAARQRDNEEHLPWREKRDVKEVYSSAKPQPLVRTHALGTHLRAFVCAYASRHMSKRGVRVSACAHAHSCDTCPYKCVFTRMCTRARISVFSHSPPAPQPFRHFHTPPAALAEPPPPRQPRAPTSDREDRRLLMRSLELPACMLVAMTPVRMAQWSVGAAGAGGVRECTWVYACERVRLES